MSFCQECEKDALSFTSDNTFITPRLLRTVRKTLIKRNAIEVNDDFQNNHAEACLERFVRKGLLVKESDKDKNKEYRYTLTLKGKIMNDANL